MLFQIEVVHLEAVQFCRLFKSRVASQRSPHENVRCSFNSSGDSELTRIQKNIKTLNLISQMKLLKFLDQSQFASNIARSTPSVKPSKVISPKQPGFISGQFPQ